MDVREAMASCRRRDWDPRLGQIAALSALLVWNIAMLSLGATILPSMVALVGALAAQWGLARLGLLRFDWRSPTITGLSLALLLRGDSVWVPAAAAAIAMASKALLRLEGKHLFNPAAFAILVMLTTGRAWVSPGQWGHSAVLVAAILCLGLLVLQRAERLDVAFGFGGAYAALLLARAWWLGDPPAIPLHQLDNGSLVLFTAFMITDPRTTPNARLPRIVFACAVACLAHGLIFIAQIPSGLYLSLVAAGLVVPWLDRSFPAGRFVWRPSQESYG